MAEGERPGLQRSLGFWSGIALVVGGTIGSGIFRSPSGVAEYVPSAGPLLLAWLAGGILSLCGALTFAELGGAFPQSGGAYNFIREAWGRMPAFLMGWMQTLFLNGTSGAAVAVVFAEYFLRTFGLYQADSPYVKWLATGAVLLLGITNIFGIRFGALVQNITTLAKVGGLMVVVVLAAVIILPRTGGNFTPFAPSGSFSAQPFGLALIAVLWAYSGWDTVCSVGGEVADPRRNIPRSILFGTIGITLIYMLANVAYLIAMPGSQMAKSPLVAADTAEIAIGSAGVLLVSITVALSTFGIVNSNLMTSPRLPFRMAEDGLFFRPFGAVHPRFKTPFVAITFRALQIIFFVWIGSFEELAGVAVVGGLPFTILATAAIYKLRRKPDYDPPVRTPLYPWVPLIVILASLALFVNSLNEPRIIPKMLLGLGVLLVAVPVYYGARLGTARPAT